MHADRNYDLEALKYTVKLLPTEDHPLLKQKMAPNAPQQQQDAQKQDDIKEAEENKIDPWARLRLEIQKHSEQNIGADESIELIENSSESIMLLLNVICRYTEGG